MHPTTKLLVFFCIAAAAVSSSTHAAGTGGGAARCVPHEREALLEFKGGITSDPTGQLASWRRDGDHDCCRWRGVRCSRRTGHVRELHLRNVHANNTLLIDDAETALVGQISPSLLSLRHLVHLDLSVQELQGPTGRVPEFLGSFKKLRYINLSCIPFIGRVPPHLGNLSRLQSLDLSQTNDVILSFGAHLSSTDISWLTRLPMLRYLNMQHLNVGDSDLNDQPPSALGGLKHLQVLIYSRSSMGTIPSMRNLCNLEVLDLSDNFLHGNIFEMLPRCSPNKLTELHLENNNVRGLPRLIGEFVNIVTLDMSNNQLTGHIPSEIGMLNKLAYLDLSNEKNQLTGTIPSEIGMLNNLAYMDLSGNNIGGQEFNYHDSRIFDMAIIDISSNFLTGGIPEELVTLDGILSLNFSWNTLSGKLSNKIGAMQSMESLDLSRNRFYG
ncbi:hypothetical protein ACQ4PT_007076 [Festuca glaucescens]